MQGIVRLGAAVAVVYLIVGGAIQEAAAQSPQAAVAERQALMRANGGAMQILAPIVRGAQPWNSSIVAQASRTLVEDATKGKALFVAGTGPDRVTTNALPSIWERKAEFDAIFDRMTAAATNLVRLAEANDQAGFAAAFPAVGQTCGACHTPFRKPSN